MGILDGDEPVRLIRKRTLLTFEGVCKKYNKKKVLENISFGVNENEIFGLVGSSGSGKTTLLKILTGMAKSDDGNIFFDGKNVSGNLKYLRKNTGFATQENMLFDELSIKENSYYFGSLYGMKRKEIKESLNSLLMLMNLKGFENNAVGNLSGGMKKRANLLIALIHKPRLLILDEPTTGLDLVLRDILWRYIREVNMQGTTIIVTSHLLEEVELNCDKIAILHENKIVDVGTPEEYAQKYDKKRFSEVFREVIGG